jgi:hypothetical protein
MSIQETVLKIKGAGDLSRVILECVILAVLLILSFVFWMFYHKKQTVPVVTVPIVVTEPLKLEVPHHPSVTRQARDTSPYKGEAQNFVASKTGKVYYPSSCKASNRIKPKNRVYFATEQLAQAKHLTLSKSCK